MSMKAAAIIYVAAVCAAFSALAAETTCDIVIYGSSPAAISAAVQAKRMGRSAVVVSPETRIGGLTTGGLGQTDIGNKSAFGGIALEFYRDVAKWYSDRAHWTRQTPEEYRPDGQCAGAKGASSMWTFEPSAALAILEVRLEDFGAAGIRHDGGRAGTSSWMAPAMDGRRSSMCARHGAWWANT